jgi:hypothetical protein
VPCIQRLLLAEPGRLAQHGMLPSWKNHRVSRPAGLDPL